MGLREGFEGMTDQRLEIFIGNLLRVGVLTAAMVVAVGGSLYLLQHHAEPVTYKPFQGEKEELRKLPGICSLAIHLRSEGLIQFGLLLLIATPVARVLLAGIGFYLEGDRLYVIISLIVLTILIYSLQHAA